MEIPTNPAKKNAKELRSRITFGSHHSLQWFFSFWSASKLQPIRFSELLLRSLASAKPLRQAEGGHHLPSGTMMEKPGEDQKAQVLHCLPWLAGNWKQNVVRNPKGWLNILARKKCCVGPLFLAQECEAETLRKRSKIKGLLARFSYGFEV